jgi:hypothetical protein
LIKEAVVFWISEPVRKKPIQGTNWRTAVGSVFVASSTGRVLVRHIDPKTADWFSAFRSFVFPISFIHFQSHPTDITRPAAARSIASLSKLLQ